LPFVREGLERGERAYHVLPAHRRQDHLDQLLSAGIDVMAAQQSRQLEVAPPEEVYLRDGRFSKEAVLEVIQEVLKAGPTLGFPLTRVIALGFPLRLIAQTLLEDRSTASEWIEYETALNDVLPHHHDAVICCYDANLLNGAIAVDLLRTTRLSLSAADYTRIRFSCRQRNFWLKSLRAAGGHPNRTVAQRRGEMTTGRATICLRPAQRGAPRK